MNARSLARRLIPFSVRLELLRLKRWPIWLVETPTIARTRLAEAERDRFQHLLARHDSPLERTPGAVDPVLQRGKERNVALAAGRLDGLVVRPHEIFSYHRTVGRPTRRRGFRPGLELQNERPSRGVGGGCCQISNTLYLLALKGGMKIVERHRHGLDLFPDHQRTVPFGCGATVFYNYADLRFENPLPQPVLLRLRIEERDPGAMEAGHVAPGFRPATPTRRSALHSRDSVASHAGVLVGELLAVDDPGWQVEVYEVDHRFFREGEARVRENRIRRRFLLPDGQVLLDQEVAHNRGRVLYDPPGEAA